MFKLLDNEHVLYLIFKESPQYSVIFNYGDAKFVAGDYMKVLL